MTIRHRLAAGTGVVAIAAALALAAAAPASAHSGQFFTNGAGGESGGFATISQTDATITLLPDVSGQYAAAVEIYAEQGFAIAGEGENNDTLYFWDHTTGAVTGSAPITLDPAFFEGAILVDVSALDTTVGSSLPDGTLLTIARINFGDEVNQGIWLSSIDKVTGILTPILDLTGYVDGFEDFLYVDSLATDPITGITYLLVDFDDGMPQYSAVDFAAGTVADPVALPGVRAVLGNGFIQGADFTDTGLLFFFYSQFINESGEAVFARLDGAITANPNGVLIGAVEDDDVSTYALAYDPAPKLAATGMNLINPVIAALALLGLGGAVLVVSRRRLMA